MEAGGWRLEAERNNAVDLCTTRGGCAARCRGQTREQRPKCAIYKAKTPELRGLFYSAFPASSCFIPSSMADSMRFGCQKAYIYIYHHFVVGETNRAYYKSGVEVQRCAFPARRRHQRLQFCAVEHIAVYKVLHFLCRRFCRKRALYACHSKVPMYVCTNSNVR